MAEIKKSGRITIAPTPSYKNNIGFEDNEVAKYISLSDYKEFYSPAIGLDLEAPSQGSSTSIKTFSSNQLNGSREFVTMLPEGKVNINFDTKDVIKDEIGGIITTNLGRGNVTNTLTAPIAGQYTIKFATKGKFTFDAEFLDDMMGWEGTLSFCINKKGVEEVIHSVPFRDDPERTILSFSFDESFTKVYDLVGGDVVQIYAKAVVQRTNNLRMDKLNMTFVTNSTSLEIKVGVSTTPQQTTFTNSNNIPIFNSNTKKIKIYGAGRDTLILQGNKLTS